MRVLLATVGSHGDIHPFIALGRALAARGHAAAVMTNPHFEGQVRAEGLEFAAIGEGVDIKDLLADGRAMHRLKGPMVVLKEMLLPLVPQMIERAQGAIREWKPDVAAMHPICLGVSWAAERAGVPCVHANLAPSTWFNPDDRLVLAPWRSERVTRLGVRTDLIVARVMIRLALDRALNGHRRVMGLPARRDNWFLEARGGALNLGLWSPLFRGPIKGDPPTGRICGFPWFDRYRQREAGGELWRFVEAGEPPVVFTLGTAAVHTAGQFYEHAAGACRLLGRRGLLLVGRAEYLPGDLPAGVEAFTYAPYSALLPRAAATVHHGGIGTTAQGLRAGRPTVVVPLSHDQFDNAARVKRMGVSETVHHSRVTAERLAGALRKVLDDAEVGRRAGEIGAEIGREDGAVRAAELMEEMQRGRGLS